MSIQLIIVVETNSKCDSDWMYIHSAIKHFYFLDQNIKLSTVYMDGKTNYNKNAVEYRIEKYKRDKKDSKNIVIYCFDLDGNNVEDIQRNKDIDKYCKKHNYDIVWFNKNIEEVFLKKTIDDKEKGKEAAKFIRKGEIKNIKQNRLNDSRINHFNSNLLLIFDKYLKRK